MIKKYFTPQKVHRHDVIVGGGDDAAMISVPKEHELVISTDTLVQDVHFLKSTSPRDIAYKALAVNLSDMAAMGATPAWMTLALTLPREIQSNIAWVEAFSEEFLFLADFYQTALIGGDLTRGPLTITIQLLGHISKKSALLRSNAKPSDLIYVTGTLGDAGFALKSLKENIPLNKVHQLFLNKRLHRPSPRIEAGEALRGLAHAAIDVSDGLAADLNHILTASRVGALVYVDQLPLSPALKALLTHEEAIKFALTAGDDYELCFTIPQEKQIELEKKFATICPCTCIGIIKEKLGFELCYQDGSKYHGPFQGFQHF